MADKSIDRALLRTLEPLRELDTTAIAELAAKTEVASLAAERQLFSRGQQDNWSYWLVGGRVEVRDETDRAVVIAANTADALKPLASGNPRPATVTALTPIDYIRIDNTLLEILGRRAGEYGVSEISEDDGEPSLRLFHRLYYDYMEGRLELPHLPDIALRVRAAVEDPEADAARVARIIQTDPLLTAKLIQVANSPLYAPGTPIYSLRNAVILLGLDTTRDLVLTYTLRDLFRSDSPLLRQRMGDLWNHSIRVSAIASELARRTPGLDPDRAMLMGLLHDIGLLPVINYAGRYPDLATDPVQLEAALERLRTQVGAMLLRHWQFGDETVEVALCAEEWQRDAASQPDYADLVIAAQLLAGRATPPPQPLPEPDNVPAFAKAARGALIGEEGAAEEVLAAADEAVTELFA